MIDLQKEHTRVESLWRDRSDANVPLCVAAALAFHRLHGNTRAIATRQDYDDALNLAAGALAGLIPIYALHDPRAGRERLRVDLARQSFARGATRLRSHDGTFVDRLSVRRSDLVGALAKLKKGGLPLLVPSAEASRSPRRNHILERLADDEYARLSPQFELVALERQQLLYTENAEPRHIYFPLSGVVSLLYITADGEPTEIAVIGNEGIVGLGVLLGDATAPRRAVVQIAGHACRIRAEPLLAEFRRGGDLQLRVLRYTQSLINQMAQTAVCNRHHTIEQQLCRWLLLTLDRIDSNEVLMTQELISHMLGVRRTGITEAAKKLQALGIIEYRRGAIRVPNRGKLAAHACECYAVVQRENVRLLA